MLRCLEFSRESCLDIQVSYRILQWIEFDQNLEMAWFSFPYINVSISDEYFRSKLLEIWYSGGITINLLWSLRFLLRANIPLSSQINRFA